MRTGDQSVGWSGIGPWRVPTAAVLVAMQLGVFVGEARGQDNECGGRGELRIRVLDESGTVPLPGAVVAIQWTETRRRSVRRNADQAGRLSVCAPGDAGGAVVWAEVGNDWSRDATVAVDAGTTSEIELRVIFAMARPGRLIGRVRDAVTNRPVATAAVSVGGLPGGESNRGGEFVMTGVAAGDHELEVRRLGYATLRHPITMSPGVTTEVNVALVPDPAEMAPLVVTAERSRRLEIKGFYERQRWSEALGLGEFFDEAYIQRWRPIRMTQFLTDHTMLGHGLTNRRMGSRGFSPEPCEVSVYVDGIRVDTEMVDFVVLPWEVGGVEVYRGPASLPARFSGFDSRCGVVAIWTK